MIEILSDNEFLTNAIDSVDSIFNNTVDKYLESVGKSVTTKGANASINWFKKITKNRSVLAEGSSKFAKQKINRYNNIKILGMGAPIPLSNLYISYTYMIKVTRILSMMK